jgi:hypothetical protein
MWLSGEWVVLMGDEPGADARLCSSCREWLPLGPSNDDDPRVAVEARAAEIAAYLGDGPLTCFDFGWHGEAGLLAAVIATHDSEVG